MDGTRDADACILQPRIVHVLSEQNKQAVEEIKASVSAKKGARAFVNTSGNASEKVVKRRPLGAAPAVEELSGTHSGGKNDLLILKARTRDDETGENEEQQLATLCGAVVTSAPFISGAAVDVLCEWGSPKGGRLIYEDLTRRRRRS